MYTEQHGTDTAASYKNALREMRGCRLSSACSPRLRLRLISKSVFRKKRSQISLKWDIFWMDSWAPHPHCSPNGKRGVFTQSNLQPDTHIFLISCYVKDLHSRLTDSEKTSGHLIGHTQFFHGAGAQERCMGSLEVTGPDKGIRLKWFLYSG